MPCRLRQRCNDDRVRCGIVACSAYRQSSSGNSVCRRNATTIASSSIDSTVELGCFGPVGRSATKLRLRHLATVFGLMPWRLARVLRSLDYAVSLDGSPLSLWRCREELGPQCL